MSELRASVVMNLRGNLEQNARRYEGSMRQLSTNGSRHMNRLQRVTGGLGRTLDRVGNRWTALATGAAGVQTIRSLTALEERFTRLGIQSNQSAEQMDELRRQIFDTAREAEIRVDPSQITSAIESIVEKTGDLEFARQNIRNIGLAISATGAEGSNIGEILAEFQKMDIRSMDQVLETIDTLNQQGKEGAFTLQNLASLGPRVVTAYTAVGREGPQAIREMGAALQVIRQGTGSSEQAATAFEALLRTFQQADKIKQLRKNGIRLYDPEELEKGRQVLRPINELMVEIVEAVDGRGSLLSGVFDAEAMRAFNAALGEYNRTGGVESLDKFLQVQGNGNTTINDSARAADTAAGAMRSLAGAWESFADENLTDYIQGLADALNSLDQETVDAWLSFGGKAAASLAGLYALRSVGKLAGDLGRGGRSLMRGRTTGGVAGGLGGAVGSMAPVPVYVTNWGGGPGGTGGAGGRRGGRPSVPRHRVNRLSNWQVARRAPSVRMIPAAGLGALGTAGLAVGGAGAAGYGVGTLLNESLLTDKGPLGTQTGREIGEAIGESVAKTLAFFGNDEAQRAVRFNEQRESTVRIQIDQEGRVRGATPEKGPGGPDLDVDSGSWGLWP